MSAPPVTIQVIRTVKNSQAEVVESEVELLADPEADGAQLVWFGEVDHLLRSGDERTERLFDNKERWLRFTCIEADKPPRLVFSDGAEVELQRSRDGKQWDTKNLRYKSRSGDLVFIGDGERPWRVELLLQDDDFDPRFVEGLRSALVKMLDDNWERSAPRSPVAAPSAPETTIHEVTDRLGALVRGVHEVVMRPRSRLSVRAGFGGVAAKPRLPAALVACASGQAWGRTPTWRPTEVPDTPENRFVRYVCRVVVDFIRYRLERIEQHTVLTRHRRREHRRERIAVETSAGREREKLRLLAGLDLELRHLRHRKRMVEDQFPQGALREHVGPTYKEGFPLRARYGDTVYGAGYVYLYSGAPGVPTKSDRAVVLPQPKSADVKLWTEHPAQAAHTSAPRTDRDRAPANSSPRSYRRLNFEIVAHDGHLVRNENPCVSAKWVLALGHQSTRFSLIDPQIDALQERRSRVEAAAIKMRQPADALVRGWLEEPDRVSAVDRGALEAAVGALAESGDQLAGVGVQVSDRMPVVVMHSVPRYNDVRAAWESLAPYMNLAPSGSTSDRGVQRRRAALDRLELAFADGPDDAPVHGARATHFLYETWIGVAILHHLDTVLANRAEGTWSETSEAPRSTTPRYGFGDWADDVIQAAGQRKKNDASGPLMKEATVQIRSGGPSGSKTGIELRVRWYREYILDEDTGRVARDVEHARQQRREAVQDPDKVKHKCPDVIIECYGVVGPRSGDSMPSQPRREVLLTRAVFDAKYRTDTGGPDNNLEQQLFTCAAPKVLGGKDYGSNGRWPVLVLHPNQDSAPTTTTMQRWARDSYYGGAPLRAQGSAPPEDKNAVAAGQKIQNLLEQLAAAGSSSAVDHHRLGLVCVRPDHMEDIERYLQYWLLRSFLVFAHWCEHEAQHTTAGPYNLFARPAGLEVKGGYLPRLGFACIFCRGGWVRAVPAFRLRAFNLVCSGLNDGSCTTKVQVSYCWSCHYYPLIKVSPQKWMLHDAVPSTSGDQTQEFIDAQCPRCYTFLRERSKADTAPGRPPSTTPPVGTGRP